MKETWSPESFYREMNRLLKRYFPGDNAVPPDDVEVRAVWRTLEYAYCVFSVRSTRGLAYVGMELILIPSITVESGENYSSEVRTAVNGWGDQLAGNHIASYLDYGRGDKIEWLGGVKEYDPKHFAELRKLKDEGEEVYIPPTAHD